MYMSITRILASQETASDETASTCDETPDDVYNRVLARYPDCPELPPLPKAAKNWSEAEFDVYVSSLGLVCPNMNGPKCSVGQVEVSPIAAGESVQTEPHIKGVRTANACLAIPSQIFMEDRAPEGLKFEAILTKFDRCRAAALQSICGVNLRILADDYGVGILLTDLSIVVDAAKSPPLISAANVESEIDLPKLPLVPSRQRLVDSNADVVCHASFGQVLVDLATKRLSQNQEAYQRLKLSCDRIFGRDLPTSVTSAVRNELAAKLEARWPMQGRLFTPQQYLKGKYVIPPADCDTYDTVYHPKTPSICEHACLSAGERFCCKTTTAFYSTFIAPLPPGLSLIVHIFVEEVNGGTRALFACEEEGTDCSCVLCTFAVYGGPLPGFLYHEEVQAVNKTSAQALMKWATKGEWKAPGACDLSLLSRPTIQ